RSGGVILPKNASACVRAATASSALAALTTCMGAAAAVMRCSRSASTGGWMTRFMRGNVANRFGFSIQNYPTYARPPSANVGPPQSFSRNTIEEEPTQRTARHERTLIPDLEEPREN